MYYPDYSFESDRLHSFLNYPDDALVRPSQLTRMGFYYSGREEEVTCYVCGVSHIHFQPRQNIRRAHAQRSPNCRLNAREDGIDYDDANVAGDDVPLDVEIPLPYGQAQPNQPVDDPNLIQYFSRELNTDITFDRSNPGEAGFRLLRIEGARLRRRTFYDWPGDDSDRERLVTQGFFYTGNPNEIQCCMSGVIYRIGHNVQGSHVPFMCPDSCRRYFS